MWGGKMIKFLGEESQATQKLSNCECNVINSQRFNMYQDKHDKMHTDQTSTASLVEYPYALALAPLFIIYHKNFD